MLAGDLNARLSNTSDFIESDTFLNDLFHTDDCLTGISDKYTLLERCPFRGKDFAKIPVQMP